jgi:acyl carrier protein
MAEQTKDRAELERQLIDIVATEAMVDISALTADTLLENLDIQSADYVMILMAVEEKFGAYISVDSAFTEARTVGDLVAIVADKIGEGSGASA